MDPLARRVLEAAQTHQCVIVPMVPHFSGGHLSYHTPAWLLELLKKRVVEVARAGFRPNEMHVQITEFGRRLAKPTQ